MYSLNVLFTNNIITCRLLAGAQDGVAGHEVRRHQLLGRKRTTYVRFSDLPNFQGSFMQQHNLSLSLSLSLSLNVCIYIYIYICNTYIYIYICNIYIYIYIYICHEVGGATSSRGGDRPMTKPSI